MKPNDAPPEDKSSDRIETGIPHLERYIQRRPHDFPGKLYPAWDCKGDGDNWPDEPGDWFDIKE